MKEEHFLIIDFLSIVFFGFLIYSVLIHSGFSDLNNNYSFLLNRTESMHEQVLLQDALSCEMSDIIYIYDSENEFPRLGMKDNRVERKKMFCSKAVYFKLNNQVIEPTKVYRDNFYDCGFVFYKVKYE